MYATAAAAAAKAEIRKYVRKKHGGYNAIRKCTRACALAVLHSYYKCIFGCENKA